MSRKRIQPESTDSRHLLVQPRLSKRSENRLADLHDSTVDEQPVGATRMFDQQSPNFDLDGDWSGWYENDKRINDQRGPISATFRFKGSRLEGEMVDGTTDSEHLYRTVVENSAHVMNKEAKKIAETIVERFPQATFMTFSPFKIHSRRKTQRRPTFFHEVVCWRLPDPPQHGLGVKRRPGSARPLCRVFGNTECGEDCDRR